MSLLLPGKHVPLNDSLIGQAVSFYAELELSEPVPQAWATCRVKFDHVTFERFALMLDVLYALQLITLEDGQIVKTENPYDS